VQGELARRTGITQGALSKYEGGVVPIGPHRVHLFAKLFRKKDFELLALVDLVVAQLRKRLARDLGKLPATGWEQAAIDRLGRGPIRGYARYLTGLTLADSAAVR
jgi:transcriptional regulator with XRE-family HTH domain